MAATSQDRDAIMREYITAITAANKEYKTSISNAISNAQRILDSKRKEASETMQAKLSELAQSKRKEASETMQAKLSELAQSTTQSHYTIPTHQQVRNFREINTKWNVVQKGGKWVASEKPVLFGH